MQHGIIEALKARARDIIIEKHERWLKHGSQLWKDIALGKPHWKHKWHLWKGEKVI